MINDQKKESKPCVWPKGWRMLQVGEYIAPGDWDWDFQNERWVPCTVRKYLNALDPPTIRRWNFKVGEQVRYDGDGDDLRRSEFFVDCVYSINANGECLAKLTRSGAPFITSKGRFIRPTFWACEPEAARRAERWRAQDIFNAIDPTNDPNVAPYLATETVGQALQQGELTEEPQEAPAKDSSTTEPSGDSGQSDHSADASKIVPQTQVPARVVYIAGPMRGIAYFNYPLFDRIAKHFRDEYSLEVISPADEDRKQDGFDPFKNLRYANPAECVFPESMDFQTVVRRCFEAVMRCDEIVLLPDWEKSKGAVAELALAIWLGKRVREVFVNEDGSLGFLGQRMQLGTLAMNLAYAHMPEPTKQPVEQEQDDAQDILEEALKITRGSRNALYGPPDQDFRRTAGMWSALFAAKLREGESFEPRDVALAMILLKTSRETHQRKRDNWVDIAGYARCGSLCN